MHILGKWYPDLHRTVNDSLKPSLVFGGLRLFLGQPITLIRNEATDLAYEGAIFDRTSEELLESQAALEAAFGLFTYVKISKADNVITVGTDRQGYSPLYYAYNGDGLVFSSSITLVKHQLLQVDPDYEAWEEIINLEDILGDKTSIKQIKRLPPGMLLKIVNGKITFHSYWKPEIPEKGEKSQYIRRNNELLMEALELTRQIPGNRTILMSGGLDSRRIGVTAAHIKLPVTIASQETVNWAGIDKDIVLAQRVAEKLGQPFMRAGILSAEGFYNDYISRDYWLGFESNQHEWILPLVRTLPPNSLLFDGITGDVTIQCGWFLEVYPELVDKWRDRDIDDAASRLCAGRNLHRMDSRMVGSTLFERVRDNIAKLPECPHRLNYYWMMNRARRNTALQGQLYSLMGHRICFPYLYYPLFMQCMSLDPEVLLEQRYQLACMSQLNPAVANMPSTRGKLGPGDFIDRAGERMRRDNLFSMMSRVRRDVRSLFPRTAPRLRIFDVAHALHLMPVARRFRWLAWPLSRMSMFMDYLEDSTAPRFPVEEKEPRFLNDRFLRDT